MKVLCFCSPNNDYVYSVDYFVAKGETLSSTGLDVFAGGWGPNQSSALAKAGADVYHAEAIGPDGDFFGGYGAAGVNTEYVAVLYNNRIGNAIIQRDKEGDISFLSSISLNTSLLKTPLSIMKFRIFRVLIP